VLDSFLEYSFKFLMAIHNLLSVSVLLIFPEVSKTSSIDFNLVQLSHKWFFKILLYLSSDIVCEAICNWTDKSERTCRELVSSGYPFEYLIFRKNIESPTYVTTNCKFLILLPSLLFISPIVEIRSR
jgi:hypothetical protein